jgi:hypothetical protein
LDELKELNDKIKNEELLNKLDQFKQNSKNQVKIGAVGGTDQEVLYRKKGGTVRDKLDKAADKQNKWQRTKRRILPINKKDINSEFKNIQDELKDLEKDNAELKSPVDLPDDVATEKYR